MVTAKPMKVLIISRTPEAQLGFNISSAFFSFVKNHSSLNYSRFFNPCWDEYAAFKVSNLSGTNSHFEMAHKRVQVTSMF